MGDVERPSAYRTIRSFFAVHNSRPTVSLCSGPRNMSSTAATYRFNCPISPPVSFVVFNSMTTYRTVGMWNINKSILFRPRNKIDLLFFHIPTDRYVAILVANEGPMDLIVEEVRHIATLLDDTAKRILNDTIGIAILATEDGPIIRYSYLAAPDAATKVAMPDEHRLMAVLSNAVHVPTDVTRT
jgi:hypothetical protein